MFCYSFSANNKIEMIFVDDDGMPFDNKAIEPDDINSEVLKKTLENSNVLIVTEPLTIDNASKINLNSKLKEDLPLFFNESLNDKFKSFKDENDWRRFFKENQISYQLSRVEEKYLYH